VDLHWQRTGPPNPRFDAMALNRIVSVVNFGALLHWHWPPKWKCVTNLAARQAASASTILQPRSHPNTPSLASQLQFQSSNYRLRVVRRKEDPIAD